MPRTGIPKGLTKLGAGPGQSDPWFPQAFEPLVGTHSDVQPMVRAFRGVCQGGFPTWRNAPFGVPVMAKRSATITVNRSAKTGRFVTPETARRHPATTETEHYKRSAPKKGYGLLELEC